MQFKYRVIGTVICSFILRGLHFKVGSNIDLNITESEYVFVTNRCKCKNIISLGESVKHSIPQLTDNNDKGETNEQLPKPVKKRAKTKNNSNI